ncbi:hypothetical protein [Leucobacter massiliensis]|uniref:hypothetical protein n=1 Tax=Leucobacter massiliensis TaxID=1686285 RepID=UPI0011B25C4C|nr:hypothetical protein [Leucobacter massiliensis]
MHVLLTGDIGAHRDDGALRNLVIDPLLDPGLAPTNVFAAGCNADRLAALAARGLRAGAALTGAGLGAGTEPGRGAETVIDRHVFGNSIRSLQIA